MVVLSEEMLRYTLVLLFSAALVSGKVLPPKLQRLHRNGRIVGGTETTIEDNPWQVSLQAFGMHCCGGCIISPDTIVTAAHCIDGLISLFYEVVSGTADLLGNGTKSKVKETIVHEGYDGLGNDVALIILKEPLTLSNTTQVVPLVDAEPAGGDTVTVTGWGNLHLYTVDVTIVDREECKADFADLEGANVDDTMICAGVPEGGKGSCVGDSGGPLTKDGQLVGIVSWSVGCGQVGYPGVYTNMVSVREWIRNQTGI
nr:S1 family serine peptidase [Tenebrio molitor]